ncbi:MAG TPA: aminotransferase class III-fold pyridoxal phosphate-dependent enzyme [Waddliaceae bacterium]
MRYTPPDLLKVDQRIAEAKRLILSAVADQQKNLTSIRPPDPELSAYYQDALKTFAKCRGTELWYPYVGSGIGKGAFVKLLDGSVKYDFITGIGVHHFGHSHPELIAAAVDGALSDLVMQGNLQQNSDSLELMELLLEESKLDHCFLTTSGTMANENGFKIAFQKNAPASRILAFEKCFAGRTLAMSQVTDKAAIREGLPLTFGVDYIPFFNPHEPEKSTKHAVEILKNYLYRYPKQYAAMIFEMVQGEGGFYPGNKEFFRTLMQILKDSSIAIIVDEVQTFGRTSKLFAFHHFEIEDLVDIVTIGKLSQVCATLWKAEYNPRPGMLSQTFTSSSTAIQVAKKMIHLMRKENFFGPEGKNMLVNQYFSQNLSEISKQHPHLIRGPYGLGAMIAFTPLDGEMKRVIQFGYNLFHTGVLSFIAGKDPTRIRLLIPVGVVTHEDINTVTKIIEETLLTA